MMAIQTDDVNADSYCISDDYCRCEESILEEIAYRMGYIDVEQVLKLEFS